MSSKTQEEPTLVGGVEAHASAAWSPTSTFDERAGARLVLAGDQLLVGAPAGGDSLRPGALHRLDGPDLQWVGTARSTRDGDNVGAVMDLCTRSDGARELAVAHLASVVRETGSRVSILDPAAVVGEVGFDDVVDRWVYMDPELNVYGAEYSANCGLLLTSSARGDSTDSRVSTFDLASTVAELRETDALSTLTGAVAGRPAFLWDGTEDGVEDLLVPSPRSGAYLTLPGPWTSGLLEDAPVVSDLGCPDCLGPGVLTRGVNLIGDGAPELVLGDIEAEGRAGCVWVITGGGDPVAQICGNAGEQFGASAAAGDLDGDGAADLVVGGMIEFGAVWVFRGPLAAGELSTSDADQILVGDEAQDQFGRAVVVHPSGWLLVGAPGWGLDDGRVGRVFRFDDVL